MNPPGTPLRWLRHLLGWLIALIILFEEWGWEPLQRAFAWVARLPVLRQLERWIATLPPYAALAILLLPSLFLLPIKILALWLVAKGLVLTGGLVIVMAKLLGTAVVAHLFSLTKPALLQLTWFAQLFHRWTAWKAHWLGVVRASWAWRAARVWKRRWRETVWRWRRAWACFFKQ